MNLIIIIVKYRNLSIKIKYATGTYSCKKFTWKKWDSPSFCVSKFSCFPEKFIKKKELAPSLCVCVCVCVCVWVCVCVCAFQ